MLIRPSTACEVAFDGVDSRNQLRIAEINQIRPQGELQGHILAQQPLRKLWSASLYIEEAPELSEFSREWAWKVSEGRAEICPYLV